MKTAKGQFYVWRIMPNNQLIKAAAFGVEQAENKRLLGIDFAYTSDYLARSDAMALDPVAVPLRSGVTHFDTSGRDLPGFLDDNTPDAWGRRVVAIRLNRRHVDTLTLLNHSSGAGLGDVLISAVDAPPPKVETGVSFIEAKEVADAVWDGDLERLLDAPHSLRLLLSGGSKPGGARPKLLVEHEGAQWIAKFNHSGDRFDVAAEEWASMRLAAESGLSAPEVRLETLGDRRCLLVKRFDLSSLGGRHHLLTLNALLKDEHTQEDAHVGRYEDIINIVRRYCIDPDQCSRQLLGQLLINRALSNTDDHLRNFSLIHRGQGWELSPAYDILPGESLLGENQLSLGGSFYLPRPSEGGRAAKMLGLTEQSGVEIGNKILRALEHWPQLLRDAGVCGDRLKALSGLVSMNKRPVQGG